MSQINSNNSMSPKLEVRAQAQLSSFKKAVQGQKGRVIFEQDGSGQLTATVRQSTFWEKVKSLFSSPTGHEEQQFTMLNKFLAENGVDISSLLGDSARANQNIVTPGLINALADKQTERVSELLKGAEGKIKELSVQLSLKNLELTDAKVFLNQFRAFDLSSTNDCISQMSQIKETLDGINPSRETADVDIRIESVPQKIDQIQGRMESSDIYMNRLEKHANVLRYKTSAEGAGVDSQPGYYTGIRDVKSDLDSALYAILDAESNLKQLVDDPTVLRNADSHLTPENYKSLKTCTESLDKRVRDFQKFVTDRIQRFETQKNELESAVTFLQTEIQSHEEVLNADEPKYIEEKPRGKSPQDSDFPELEVEVFDEDAFKNDRNHRTFLNMDYDQRKEFEQEALKELPNINRNAKED